MASEVATNPDLVVPKNLPLRAQERLTDLVLIEAHGLLTEKIPTVIIEPEILGDPDGLTYWGKLYNPGKTPNLEKLGLALSQVAAAARLFETVHGNKGKQRTPMVTEIESLSLTEAADQNFTSGELLDLEVDMSADGDTIIGRVMLEEVVLCEAKMTMKALPLKESLLDRMRRFAPEESWDKPNGETLPDLAMPGFGDTWVMTDRVVAGAEEYGTIAVPAGLFEGHFPEVDIVPIAGSARPGFWLAENHFARNGHEGHSEVKSLQGLSIPAPLKPNDVLDYRVTALEETGAYRIEVFFREGDKHRLAAQFDHVQLGEATRKKQLWQHDNVAEAFAAQDQIPTYSDHVSKVVNAAVEAALNTGKPDLVMADVGTGIGRIIEAVLLDERLDLQAGKTDIHLTDVSPRALDLANDKLRNRFGELMGDRLKIITNLTTKAGEIIPEDWPKQDVIMGNFSFYGNLDQAFGQAYENLNPGGVLVLGMVHENPNYNLLMLSEAERLKGDFKPDEYGHDLVMSDVGLDLCEDALLHRRQCEYISPEECEARLKQAGFRVEVVEDSSFCGIGYIIKGYKI